MKKYFLTGTDTNVGKTIICCAILEAGKNKGYKTAGYKPIASGGKKFSFGLRSSDAILLKKYSSIDLEYSEVNPINFSQATSPNIASEITGKSIDLKIVTKGLEKLKKKCNFIIIEGIGGWYTPISTKNTIADWVISEKLPVILVVGLKLGCINHTLLTINAIKQSSLSLVGWIANRLTLNDPYQEYYLSTLKKITNVPIIGSIPYLPNWKSSCIKNFINIEKIL